MSNFSIDSENNLFRKFIPTNKFQHEVDMSKGAYEMASETELFDTPIIKEINSEKNEIDFELLEEITTLRAHFISNFAYSSSAKQLSEFKQLFSRIGKSLNLIHSGKKYFEGISRTTFPDGFFKADFNKDLVYIHGDFTLSNLLYGKNNKLFIIDWNTSPVYGFSASCGPRYWDLSFFISSLFYFSISTFFSFKVRKELAKEFLSGYLKESDLDTEEFLKEFSEFLNSYNYYKLYDSIYKSNKSVSEKLLIIYTKNRLNNFIVSLPDLLK